jgi:ATP-dependent exoDNAse (exonuclease V) beta subunit
VESIVAVTFTHAAAGNMKLRVRHQLEQRRASELDPEIRDRLAHAARSLDRAFIGTIHAFCAQLLRRRPVEAGVDPVFQELAQPDALRIFAAVFQRWIEQRLASPSPALVRALARLSWREERDGAEPLDAIRMAAWSLAEWRDFNAPWDKRGFDRDAGLRTLLDQAETTLDLRNRCSRRKDDLHDGLRPLAEFLERVNRARDAGLFDGNLIENELLRLPRDMKWLKHGHGKYGDGIAREAMVAAWEELREAIEEFGRHADADLAAQLRDELWEVVGLYQERKRLAGQLDFMDLLLYARDLLQHDGARGQLQKDYRRIFVDEFQDTDPLQAEILLLLAAADPAERDWRNALPSPGKLYVVGDPKQSIYRFRRADARLFRRVCRWLTGAGVASQKLPTSTRSTRTIQAFVNAAFAGTIPDYLPLEGGAEDPADQPSVVALPMPEPYGTRNLSNVRIEACSPNAVAAFIQWLCTESGWTVRDLSTGARVAIQPEHVCILFRRFTNFGTDLTQEYVRALEARGIAHLLVGSKSFHRREEVGTLRTALRAIEWPACSPFCAAAYTPCATILCSNSATPMGVFTPCASCPTISTANSLPFAMPFRCCANCTGGVITGRSRTPSTSCWKPRARTSASLFARAASACWPTWSVSPIWRAASKPQALPRRFAPLGNTWKANMRAATRAKLRCWNRKGAA